MENLKTTTDLEALLNLKETVGTLPAETSALKRAKDVLLQPQTLWARVLQEKGGLREAFLPYVVIVGFVPALAGAAFSATVWGLFQSLFGGTPSAAGLSTAVFGSMIHFATWMLGLLICAKIVELVAPSFGLRQSWVLSCRALVYGATPSFLASVLTWIPILGWLIALATMVWSMVLTFGALKTLLAPMPMAAIQLAEDKSADELQLATHA